MAKGPSKVMVGSYQFEGSETAFASGVIVLVASDCVCSGVEGLKAPVERMPIILLSVSDMTMKTGICISGSMVSFFRTPHVSNNSAPIFFTFSLYRS